MVQRNVLGQHWTFGQAVPVQPVAPVSTLPILPIILCLGLILLAIAGTIILSIIPTFTPRHGVNPTCTSAPFSSTFNLNNGVLPFGGLSSGNQGAFQSGLNQYIAGQSGFSRCTAQVANANVNSCSRGKRSLTRRRRRYMPEQGKEDIYLVRRVRQTNNNCNNQQLASTATLNCGCTCVGICLKRKVAQLQNLLFFSAFPVTFPEPTSQTISVTGVNLPTSMTTTTTMASVTSAMMG